MLWGRVVASPLAQLAGQRDAAAGPLKSPIEVRPQDVPAEAAGVGLQVKQVKSRRRPSPLRRGPAAATARYTAPPYPFERASLRTALRAATDAATPKPRTEEEEAARVIEGGA